MIHVQGMGPHFDHAHAVNGQRIFQMPANGAWTQASVFKRHLQFLNNSQSPLTTTSTCHIEVNPTNMATQGGQCANCGSSTTKVCPLCNEGLDKNVSPSDTCYCSKACQKADWEPHKSVCRLANARKQLYRGAALVQEVYYAFRETAFDIDPEDIKVIGGKIHFSLAKIVNIEEMAKAPEWPLFPFPKSALPELKDRQTLLVWNNCDDAMAYMHEFFEKAFKGKSDLGFVCGIADWMELGAVDFTSNDSPLEQKLTMKDELKTVVRNFPDGGTENVRFSHMVLNVAIGEGNRERYIVDPTGAQFRQYRAVMPQEEYIQKYVMATGEMEKFGHWNQRWKNAVEYQNDPIVIGSNMRVMALHQEIVKGINKVVNEWEEEAGKTIAQMLNQKNAAFKADKAKLIKDIVEDMCEYLAWLKTRPKLFASKRMKKTDLPEWRDDQNPKPKPTSKSKAKPTYGKSYHEDVKAFLREQHSQGTPVIVSTPTGYKYFDGETTSDMPF